MKGLMIWAHGRCRATMAFYEGLADAFGVPLHVVCCYGGESARGLLGLNADEFPHIKTRVIGSDANAIKEEYASHKTWHHVFGTYQKGGLFRDVIVRAKLEGQNVAVMSEAPCVMRPPPWSIINKTYVRFVLRAVVRRQISSADFILNCSGDHDEPLLKVGWPQRKVIPCGYFPPPLIGSRFVERVQHPKKEEFTLLMTGLPEWHRNPFVFLKALQILKRKCLPIRTIITQDGPLSVKMKRYACKNSLNVEFLGRVPLEKLIDLYQTCSCFVATGRSEPWGMRLNDALHCGAPLVVSTGMGAAKLVDDYGCGLTFKSDDARDLAEKLEIMVTDASVYQKAALRVKHASMESNPSKAATRYASEIRDRFSAWR